MIEILVQVERIIISIIEGYRDGRRRIEDEETGDRGVMMIKWSLQITGKKSNQIEQPWLFPFTPITVHDGFNGFCFFDPWISRAGSPRF